jgi:glutamate N-acetyltransferase/amino-acid N-acetyltransferase
MLKELETSIGCLDTLGFKAEGVHCDVRNKGDGRLDLAIVWSEQPSVAAGVFTRNRMAAAPVALCREVLAGRSTVRAIVVNSGNANACTGKKGREDAIATQNLVADNLGCSPEEIFVCSTGRIGEPLPMDKIEKGIAAVSKGLSTDSEASHRAADAILTSDTGRKVCSVDAETPAGIIRVSGMAKGAGMIEPNMATMLGFLCTDADIGQEDLQRILFKSVQGSFNAITVDGDESTNDSVLMLANGCSGITISPEAAGWKEFSEAVDVVCHKLAKKIVSDGEKITKVVELCVEGAATGEDAAKAARAIANSLLVKSSWYGNDPNWGRVMDALGYSGARLSEDSVQMWYESDSGKEVLDVFGLGRVHNQNKDGWKTIVSEDKFRIRIGLGQGTDFIRIWSTDLTEGYVNFNKSE